MTTITKNRSTITTIITRITSKIAENHENHALFFEKAVVSSTERVGILACALGETSPSGAQAGAVPEIERLVQLIQPD